MNMLVGPAANSNAHWACSQSSQQRLADSLDWNPSLGLATTHQGLLARDGAHRDADVDEGLVGRDPEVVDNELGGAEDLARPGQARQVGHLIIKEGNHGLMSSGCESV
eukprot:scaffold106910_cov18-Prasinocladus_malaysianus.AAC.1